jgi:hypothetical protein
MLRGKVHCPPTQSIWLAPLADRGRAGYFSPKAPSLVMMSVTRSAWVAWADGRIVGLRRRMLRAPGNAALDTHTFSYAPVRRTHPPTHHGFAPLAERSCLSISPPLLPTCPRCRYVLRRPCSDPPRHCDQRGSAGSRTCPLCSALVAANTAMCVIWFRWSLRYPVSSSRTKAGDQRD